LEGELEDDIKLDLKEIVCEILDWGHLAEGRFRWMILADMVLKLEMHKRREFLAHLSKPASSLSRRALQHEVAQ
jgi:hypothetical protein